MVKVAETPPALETIKDKTAPVAKKFKPIEDFSIANESLSIANMVERFVQSISNINDSGSFDTSFEVKHIQSPQRVRHRCVTELDRENLMKFVQEFEARQEAGGCSGNNNNSLNSKAAKSTTKSSPFFCRKFRSPSAAAATQVGKDTNNNNNKHKQTMRSADIKHYDAHESLRNAMLMPAPARPTSTKSELLTSPNDAESRTLLQRSQPERSSYRSAAKVLQFFSAKKKSKQLIASAATADSSRSSSATVSPVLMRAHLGCSPLPSDADAEDDEHDDGISSAGSNITQTSSGCSVGGDCSRNGSPDSSFEMHPPLVPSFKVTPPQTHKACRNPAYEFARFLRGSFHAKRATVTTLRRSISDPDSFQQLDFTKAPPHGKSSADCCATTRVLTTKAAVKKSTKVLADATNVKRSEAIRNRALPSNASPFRRAWGQSSFRTPRTDKHTHQHSSQLSPLVRRTASMTASDNDVYIKSMDTYIDELKQTRSQQQLGVSGEKSNAIVTANNTAAANIKPAVVVTAAAVNQNAAGPVGVVSWGTSFERMLEDPAGLHTFAEFLKKEFSAENIYFWTACERFRHLDSESERATQAMAIFSKHLANGSLEPVNVDSQARNLTEEKLQSAERDIFAHAQKQIFNLMKFDSYQRFIRSDMYKSCMEAEEKHQPLPYAAEDLDELLRTNFHQVASSKLKKSASNAEDRRRKSLLPWHRKTRCKSRDRAETDGKMSLGHHPSRLPQLSSSSLKIPSTQNSTSDIHSSRSSLSSFDTMPGSTTHSNGQLEEIKPCLLCRVILSDGATTIVQTRPGDTVGQLVERLLEKRGLCYHFYDVVINGSSKSIDLQSAAQTLAGKEVLIEQRVAFKLDLPDPKVISVKSKPKKQLHEVIRPILQKYNYCMDTVQVLLRDTHEQLDLSLPVTVADGQRLQIVMLKAPCTDLPNGNSQCGKITKPSMTKSVSFPTTKLAATAAATRIGVGAPLSTNPHQSTLDEITNKVFNELLQSKVEAHASGSTQPALKAADLCSLKSEDCASEASSIFNRMRRRDSNIPGMKLKPKKKPSSNQSDEPSNINAPQPTSEDHNCTTLLTAVKKPIIAKLKAGVKLQVTERAAENQDELLEGLKRAQLARLEDQRGTEINFELPDFLKNKENLSVANKLRKVRANLSPVNKSLSLSVGSEEPQSPLGERPQPAPRLSIANKNRTNISPMKIDEEEDDECDKPTNNHTNNAASNSSLESEYATTKGPPPLPPKPKVLPIKPSNWGVTTSTSASSKPNSATASLNVSAASSSMQLPSKIPIDISRKHLGSEQTGRCAYLEEPSSSFV